MKKLDGGLKIVGKILLSNDFRSVVEPLLSATSFRFEGRWPTFLNYTVLINRRGVGQPSIPPERSLRALLLQAFFSIRSERQLMEQLD